MAYELFFDGFESYSAASDLLKFGYNVVPNLVNSSGRRSSKCLQFANVNPIAQKLITASTHVVVGVAIKTPMGAGISLRNGSTEHASVWCAANNLVSASAGGVALGTSVNTFPYDTYMFVEIGVVVGNSGSYEVRINGSSVGWFPAATADTQNGATTTIDTIRLSGQSYSTSYFDDFYIAYGNELVWLGDSRVDRLLLTANTATQDWTPSTGNAWERLNAGDGYVESATDEATSLFEVADLNYSPLSIHGVKTAGLIKKSDAGYREACLLSKSGATTVESAAVALSTDTLGFTQILKTDPATGAAWGLPAVHAFQPGLRVKV